PAIATSTAARRSGRPRPPPPPQESKMTDHNQPRWQREFGDMPTGTFPATPDGWDDESWRNDVCPHFVAAEGEGWVLTVWVDYPDKADREFPSLKRFRAYFEDP